MPKMKYTLKDSVFTFIFKQPEYTRQLYLAATYKEYAEEQKLNLYGTEPVTIPRPELYVVYTGDQEDVPETLLLSDLYGGSGDAEVRVKVLRGTGNGDIVDQYVRFCKIADEERKRHGRSGKAIEETLRRCIEENVLAPFLMTRQKEVAEIMVTLFDQEKVMEIHDYHVAEAARKDGLQEGRAEGTLSSIKNLMETLGLSIEAAMNALKIPDDERTKYANMLGR